MVGFFPGGFCRRDFIWLPNQPHGVSVRLIYMDIKIDLICLCLKLEIEHNELTPVNPLKFRFINVPKL